MSRKMARPATCITALLAGSGTVVAVGPAFAAPPAGTYTRNVTSTELQKAGSAAPYGIWTLKVTPRGFSLDAKGQGRVPERAAWTHSQVTVSDTPGSISIFCGANINGAYRSARTGSKLTLKLVKDGCKERAGVLAGVWKKST